MGLSCALTAGPIGIGVLLILELPVLVQAGRLTEIVLDLALMEQHFSVSQASPEVHRLLDC
jgi:hypothetical protein